ncbi:hypothetical protein QUA80_24330 [Microcoleus sp. F4-D5]
MFFTKYTFVKKNPILGKFQTERVVSIQQFFNLKSQTAGMGFWQIQRVPHNIEE